MSSLAPPQPAGKPGSGRSSSPSGRSRRQESGSHADGRSGSPSMPPDRHLPPKSQSSTWAAGSRAHSKSDSNSAGPVRSPAPAATIRSPKKTTPAKTGQAHPAPAADTASPIVTVQPASASPFQNGFGLSNSSVPALTGSGPAGRGDAAAARLVAPSHKRPKSSSATGSGRQSTSTQQSKPGGAANELEDASAGFFSSVLSAAGGALKFTPFPLYPKPKAEAAGADANTGDAGGEEVIMPPEQTTRAGSVKSTPIRPAIDTIGAGNLSLSDLGIAPDETTSLMSVVDEQRARADGASSGIPFGVGDGLYTHRSRASTNGTTIRTSTTGPIGSDGAGGDNKRVERGPSHRRNGSVTNSDIHAAGSVTPLQKQSTFAFAPSARNKAFHEIFRSVPKDDRLIEDYSAALQREILLQGRLYISQGHICFFSNIIGWTTSVVISFDEIISVRKKWTAKIFPNGLIVETLHARNVFASLLSRDSTFELIARIWRTTHPNLKQVENGFELNQDVPLARLVGDEGSIGPDSFSGSDDESVESVENDEDVYDEDAEPVSDPESDVHPLAPTHGNNAGGGIALRSSVTSPDLLMGAGGGGIDMTTATAAAAAAASAAAAAKMGNIAAADSMASPPVGSAGATALTEAGGTAGAAESPLGPIQHAPTNCGDSDKHYDKELIDTVIPAPLGKIHSLMFGPESGKFMRNWLTVEQKCFDLQLEDDGRGLDATRRDFNYSYIRPLYATIGPKQTRCLIHCHVEQFDFNKAISILSSTTNPDVPSGKVFSVKTRFCLMWGPDNSTRLVVNYTVEWTGSSFIKGPIERNAHEGQLSYVRDLAAALTTAAGEKSISRAGRKSKRIRKRDLGLTSESAVTARRGVDDRASVRPGQSVQLEPSNIVFDLLRPLVGSTVIDILGLVFSISTLVTVLAVSVILLFFRQRRLESSHSAVLVHQGVGDDESVGRAVRMATGPFGECNRAPAEERWVREQDELWEWIDARLGHIIQDPIGSIHQSASSPSKPAKSRPKPVLVSSAGRAQGGRRDSVRMGSGQNMFEFNPLAGRRVGKSGNAASSLDDRRLSEAIRTTRERLDALEKKLEQQRAKQLVREPDVVDSLKSDGDGSV